MSVIYLPSDGPARISSAIIDGDVSLDQVLRTLDEHPTVAAYTQAARAVRSLWAGLRPARIALLATFTIDGLKPYLEVEAARRGFAADVYVAPFDSVKQELLDAGRGCVGHR